MYSAKISFIVTYRLKNIKNTNLNPREIAYFLKFAKIYTRENIYVHSSSMRLAQDNPVFVTSLICGALDGEEGVPMSHVEFEKTAMLHLSACS